MINNYPKVSIIILNWNGFDDSINCLNSLKIISYPNFNIILVDNGSENNEGPRLKEKYGSFIHLIATNSNLGFGAGNNVGIRFAIQNGCDYILLLNNDTIVTDNFLNRLVEIAGQEFNLGAVGPKLIAEDGRIQLDSVARFPTLIDQFYLWSFLYPIGRYLFRQKLFIPKYLMLDFDRESQKSVDMICGACMLLPSKTLNQIGLFDENFFLFAEDMDLCYRIKTAGFNIVYTPRSVVTHLKNKSVNKLSTKHFVVVPLNTYLFYTKHFSQSTATKFKIIVLIFIITQLIFWAIKNLINEPRFVNLINILRVFKKVIIQLTAWESTDDNRRYQLSK